MRNQGKSLNVKVSLEPPKLPAKRKLSQAKSPLNKVVRGDLVGCATSSLLLKEEDDQAEQQQWTCHTTILNTESPYFAALLGENFIESNASAIYLPPSVINPEALENIIHYMYKHTIPTTNVIDLCNIYSAADYLGMGQLCMTITELLKKAVHQCNCYCQGCVKNIPELFLYCRKLVIELQDDGVSHMTQKIISIWANDPEKSLPTYWTSRHMARLLTQLPQDVSQAILQKILHHVKKSNAIESLYACYTASNTLCTNDPLLSWSKPLHATLASVQFHATLIIAHHFNFFCSQYPALLSCIDGITYSLDFLEYLLLHILEDQMDSTNVGILYQGIVCDLMGRHAVQHNEQVKDILNVAKVMILYYINRKIGDIQQHGSLDKLEINILRSLAEGIDFNFTSRSQLMFKEVLLDLDMKTKSLISSNHPLYNRCPFFFCSPSISDLKISGLTHTNGYGLSTHSSMSTTSSRHTSVPASQSTTLTSHIMKRLARLFRESNNSNPYQLSSSRQLSPNRLSRRIESFSAAYTVSSSACPNSRRTNMRKTSITSKRFSTAESGRSHQVIGLNRRVQLSRRPVLTVGTVLYIGQVHFAEGTWVGVELDRRVGKNDGSVGGVRYFTSSPNRGVFVRPEDITLVI